VYNELRSTAIQLIAKYGRNVTVITYENSGYDYDPVQTEETEVIKAVVTSFRANEVDGTIIQKDDKMLITTSSLNIAQKIQDGSRLYKIVSVDEIKPSDTAIIYKAVIRK
jgi:hypothetical protein